MLRTCLALAVLAASVVAQQPVSDEDVARADAAVREAFAFLYALPSDTAAAPMGSWVIDSNATKAGDARWRIVVTRLADTGHDLKLSEMVGEPGTSPAQLAASMAAMQRLEGKISKAEAESALEVVVTINEPELTLAGVSDVAERAKAPITGAALAIKVSGDWMHLDNRELEIDYERWSPAALLVGFGAFGPIETRRAQPLESASAFTARARVPAGRRGISAVAVTAQGNQEMLERVVRETKWAALAALAR